MAQTVFFREPGAARAAGYALAIAGPAVALGLCFHPLPSGGFAEKASVLSTTPLWGPIHVLIAGGFVLCILGGLLALAGGGALTARWQSALAWGAITVGMIFFSGVALINGYVMHKLAAQGAGSGALFDAFNDLLVGYGWLGDPLFLFGLTLLAYLEWRYQTFGQQRWLALIGLISAALCWLRGAGSAFGIPWLEPFVLANIPAFLWLGLYGVRIARLAAHAHEEKNAVG